MRIIGALFLLVALPIAGCASRQAKTVDLPDGQPRVPVNRTTPSTEPSPTLGEP